MKTMKIQRVLLALPAIMLMSILPMAAQQKNELAPGKADAAQKEAPPKKTGTIQMVDSFDWGTVAPGKLEAEIEIKNVGAGLLTISRIQPSCGCTVPQALSDSTLEPGQSVMMHLSLDGANRSGPQHKSVAVYTDDPNNATKIVKLTANIQRDVAFNPDVQYLNFSNAVVGKETQASIRVQNTGAKPITIYPPEITEGNSGVHFNLTSEKVLQPGEEYELVASVTPANTTAISGKALLKTSSDQVPNRVFMLYGGVTEQAAATAPETSSLSGNHDETQK